MNETSDRSTPPNSGSTGKSTSLPVSAEYLSVSAPPDCPTTPLLSPAGSPAKTSAASDGWLESQAPRADCGQSLPGSFAWFDLNSSLWRTWQGSLWDHLDEFSETWPRAGMTRSGIAYQLPQLVPGISGTGCSSYPIPGQARFTTPTADDVGHRKKPYSQGGHALSYQLGGPPNPDWQEWLMGFPVGWTALDGSDAAPSVTP